MIFSFDMPAHGLSREKFLRWGKYELDLLRSLSNWISKNQNNGKEIILFGESMGGSLALQLGHIPSIKKIISDSAYSSLSGIFLHQGTKQYGFLAQLFLRPALFFAELLIGANFEDLSPINVVNTIDKPTLIIHSKQDRYTPVNHAHELIQKAKGNQKISSFITDWGAGHGQSFKSNPAAYTSKILEFISSH